MNWQVIALWLGILTAGAAEAATPAGHYRLVGEQDVASQLVLHANGRFEYFLMAGALDERSRGIWAATDAGLVLTTDPKPVPPILTLTSAAKSPNSPLTLLVTWPDGSGIPGVDIRITFANGEALESYTQEDGWTLPAEELRVPRTVLLGMPMYNLSADFPIDISHANALTFTLTPNDLGLVDFDKLRLEVAGEGLIMHRGDYRLTYEREN